MIPAYLEVSNDDNIGRLGEVLDVIGSLELLGDRAGLLLEPSDDRRGVTSTSVLGGLAVAEELERGVAADLQRV